MSTVRSKRRSGTGGGGRAARRCLMEGGLRFSGVLLCSMVARSRGELEGDGDPRCGFCPRDGGGGGGRLRKEPLSELDSSGGEARGSVWSSRNGVGEGRRLTGVRGPSNRLVSPMRGDLLGNGAGASLAFCSNMFRRSFTAGVTLTSTSCERGDIQKGGVGDWQEDESRRNDGECQTK
jgi:hypothetical protein